MMHQLAASRRLLRASKPQNYKHQSFLLLYHFAYILQMKCIQKQFRKHDVECLHQNHSSNGTNSKTALPLNMPTLFQFDRQ